MDWWRLLGPRDERIAARNAASLYVASAVVIILSTVFIPAAAGPDRRPLLVSLPVLFSMPMLLMGGLLFWSRTPYKQLLVVLCPVIGVALVAILNLVTHDDSAGAQVAFCLPVLFAASQLRALGAVLGAVAAVVGDVIVVWQLNPHEAGAFDVINVTLVLSLMTGMLALAGRRQDRLVALLESRASHDPLTGLVTRRVLDEAVINALATPGRHAGTALILVDVDRFKSINDSYGHPVGDDALVHVATVLQRRSRPDTMIGRLGGDEMAVLIPDCPPEVAVARAREFLDRIRSSPLTLPDGSLLAVSLSIGVGHAPAGESDLREIYAAADASLYEAKRNGRGRVGRYAGETPVFERPIDTPF